MDLGGRIAAVLAVDPAATAVYASVGDLTWGDVGTYARALEQALLAGGAARGASVAVLLRNRPPQLAAAVGVLAGSRCLVTMNPLVGDASLAGELALAKHAVIVAETSDWERSGVDEAVAAHDGFGLELTGDAADPVRVRHRSPSPEIENADGVAVRMLTSGTTGAPKRVDLTYRALTQSLRSAEHYESEGHEVVRLHTKPHICTLPLMHISGLWNVIKAVVDGRPTALLERFEVGPFVDLVRTHRPPVCGLTPTAVRMLLEGDVDPDDVSSLRAIIVGTAPTPPDLVDRFLETYGVPLLVVYGATEFAGGVAGWTLRDFKAHWNDKRGSVGRPHPGVTLRVVDPEHGTSLPAGSTGVLEVRGDQLDGVDGRRGDDWVRTNDLACLDEDGFLFIVGRADDVINRGGFKVSPAKVVDVLQRHPAVVDAGVTGLEDDRLGAVPVAAVEVSRHTEPPSEEELLAFARIHLAPYEVPRSIIVVDRLPRTASMKVSQPDLKVLFR